MSILWQLFMFTSGLTEVNFKRGSKRRQTRTATCQNGDTKTVTDCQDQNGDKLKQRQVKTAMGTVF